MAVQTAVTKISGGDAGAFPDGILPAGSPSAVVPTGSTQADAAAMPEKFSTVTGADGTKGTRLPAIGTPGEMRFVYNATATNGLKVYPASGEAINGGTVDVNISLEGKTLALFLAESSTNWACIFTVNV